MVFHKEKHGKSPEKAFYKHTRENFSKSLSYCEWDPVKIWYSEDFNGQEKSIRERTIFLAIC